MRLRSACSMVVQLVLTLLVAQAVVHLQELFRKHDADATKLSQEREAAHVAQLAELEAARVAHDLALKDSRGALS